MSQIEQRSDEWFAARCGLVTASRVADVIAKTAKGAPGAMRATYMAQLVAERLTGNTAEGFTSSAMQWGTDQEPAARSAYEFFRDQDVAEVGFVVHPTIKDSGASPDGLVGEDGLVEIKCPNTATHIETLLGQSVPGKYLTQMQWQMACTGRRWCDFASFDPRMPQEMQLFVKRVARDDALIADLEKEVAIFLAELALKVKALSDLYLTRAAA